MIGSVVGGIAKRPLLAVLALALAATVLSLAGVYAYTGSYGLNVVLRRGGSLWVAVKTDDARLSPSMRLALRPNPPQAQPGPFAWRSVAGGFDVAELPVVADGAEVDRILLARIDPAHFRFEVLNAPAGDKDLGAWMETLHAALVINGSYFSRYGTPDTPFLSKGAFSGPRSYDAKHGAFVASKSSVRIRDLGQESWQQAFRGAEDAMVSYPLLLAADGSSRVTADRRWLANRSFVGQTKSGEIVLGTTADAFFSLDRLAEFLRRAPLDLELALNLDGGPVACQGIALGDYRRDFCGDWELAAYDGTLKLLTPALGKRRWAMPIVLAVYPK